MLREDKERTAQGLHSPWKIPVLPEHINGEGLDCKPADILECRKEKHHEKKE